MKVTVHTSHATYEYNRDFVPRKGDQMRVIETSLTEVVDGKLPDPGREEQIYIHDVIWDMVEDKVIIWGNPWF